MSKIIFKGIRFTARLFSKKKTVVLETNKFAEKGIYTRTYKCLAWSGKLQISKVIIIVLLRESCAASLKKYCTPVIKLNGS